jgi:hypothetical protein
VIPEIRVQDRLATVLLAAGFAVVLGGSGRAQEQPGPLPLPPQHEHPHDSTASELFAARDASGTAWVPYESPVYGVHWNAGRWQVMLHGTAFAQLLYEPGEKHRTGGFESGQFSSVNWVMAVARRGAGAGRVGLRAMASVEPWTVRHCGFINLLASGEMCQGDTIHDRQHPHDLFMELAADYDRPVRGSLRWQVYGGLAGEPALGPSAFPHRLSAMPNPIAPITHHWLDSSHIAFGLITAGLYQPRWKTELSVFNGREPDEERADLDLDALDSVSARLTFMPSPRLALQVSAGYLHAAEAEFPPQPRSDLVRSTASATYHRLVGANVWAATAAYAVNSGDEVIPGDVVHLVTHAVLVESSLTSRARDTWFGRIEVVGKPGHDLHVHPQPARVFPVAKGQVGYERRVWMRRSLAASVGGTASLGIVPPALQAYYSGRLAPGFGVFFNVRPSRHLM